MTITIVKDPTLLHSYLQVPMQTTTTLKPI